MIRGVTGLIAFQIVGEFVVRLFDLPVPGPVLGMLLLFIWLRLRRVGDQAALVRAGTALLEHLQLFFVPAGVAIVVYLSTLGEDALPITVSVLASWAIGLVVIGWTAVGLERLTGRPHDDLSTGRAGPGEKP